MFEINKHIASTPEQITENKPCSTLYFDGASTTMVPKQILDYSLSWINRGNGSSDYQSAKLIQKLISQTSNAILQICNLNANEWMVILNSGASESNSTMIHMLINSFKKTNTSQPTIIASAIEHSSILQTLYNANCKIKLLPVNYHGDLDIQNINNSKAILCCVMHANNETGNIHNINEISKLCKKNNIPLHVDIVQTFTKISFDYSVADSLSLSFHKIHGMQGVGAHIIRRKLIDYYKLKAIIGGSQNNEMRSGTYNTMGIASAFSCLKYSLSYKNQLNENGIFLRKTLNEHFVNCHLSEYEKLQNNKLIEMVWISNAKSLPHIVLVSFINKCNLVLKQSLYNNNIIISIGSACNTFNKLSSHVLFAMNCAPPIRRGAIRISLQPNTTKTEITKMCKILKKIIKN